MAVVQERPRAFVLVRPDGELVRVERAAPKDAATMNELLAARGLPLEYRRATALEVAAVVLRDSMLRLGAAGEGAWR